MLEKLSCDMISMLREIRQGEPIYFGGGPKMILKTNPIANKLFTMGLIAQVEDHAEIWENLQGWVITDEGEAALKL